MSGDASVSIAARKALTQPPVVARALLRNVDARDARVAPHPGRPPSRRVSGPVERARHHQHLVVRTDGRVAIAQDLDHAQPAHRPPRRRRRKLGPGLERRVRVRRQLRRPRPPREEVDVARELPRRRDRGDRGRRRGRRRGRVFRRRRVCRAVASRLLDYRRGCCHGVGRVLFPPSVSSLPVSPLSTVYTTRVVLPRSLLFFFFSFP